MLLKDGRLVDTTKGEAVPADGTPMPATTAEDVQRLRRMTADEIKECVVRDAELDKSSIRVFGNVGLSESAIVGAENADEEMPAGKISWPHGFHLRRWKIDPGYATPWHRRSEAEVIMMHHGRLNYLWEGGELEMQAGDVLTAPIGLARRYVSRDHEAAIAYVVRGGDAPSQFTQADQ